MWNLTLALWWNAQPLPLSKNAHKKLAKNKVNPPKNGIKIKFWPCYQCTQQGEGNKKNLGYYRIRQFNAQGWEEISTIFSHVGGLSDVYSWMCFGWLVGEGWILWLQSTKGVGKTCLCSRTIHRGHSSFLLQSLPASMKVQHKEQSCLLLDVVVTKSVTTI